MTKIKFIFTGFFLAMLLANVAHADIASTKYVDGRTPTAKSDVVGVAKLGEIPVKTDDVQTGTAMIWIE